MELTRETGASFYTDSELVLASGDKKQNDVIKFEFDWKTPVHLIEYVETSCSSCTKAWFENGKIVGTLDLSKAQTYVPGQTVVTKDVFVWLNDGENRFIPNEKRQKTLNPNKKFVRFRITAVVHV